MPPVRFGINTTAGLAEGIFDRFRSLPISRSARLTGTIMGDFFRYLVSVTMVFAFAVGWIWVLLGLHVKSPQSLQGFGVVVMFPLTFGSNVFVRVSTLPGWLQAWVKVNPVSALTDASRGLALGAGPVAAPAWHSVAWAIAITAVFAPLAVRRYRR